MALFDFLGISERVAKLLYDGGYILLVLAGLVGFIGTVALYWGDKAKSRYADKETQELKTEAAKANENAAKANERTAELTVRANSAELELQRLRTEQGPRAVKLMQAELTGDFLFSSFLRSNPKGQALIWYRPSDPEAEAFARNISDLLQNSGWSLYSDIAPIPRDLPELVATAQRKEIADMQAKNLSGSLKTQYIDDSVPLVIATSGGRNWNAEPIVPAKALIDAFLKCGFNVSGGGNANSIVPANTVLIVVGQKQ